MNKLMDLETTVKPGTELTSEELEVINFWRKKEFDKEAWSHDGINYFHKNLFFIIRNTEQIVSFGMLIPIDIFIDKQKYSIDGIATIFSVVRGKGYGKFLMQEMKKYIQGSDKIAIGFCNSKNTEFYKKCGYSIWENGIDNFIYIDEEGKEIKDDGGDTLYLDNSEHVLENAIKSNKLIYHFFPHW